MKYDDAEIYFLNFATDLPNENGGRHMGLYLEWAIRRGLASDELMQEAERLRTGATTGLDVLFDRCDGKLLDSDFNDEGNSFAVGFFAMHLLNDYIDAMNLRKTASADEIFGAELTPQRRDRMNWMFDRRYSDWRRQLGLPGRQELANRLFGALDPVAAAAGFTAAEDGYGSHSIRRRYERSGPWGSHGVSVVADDTPGSFYGVQVELNVHADRLGQAIVKEKEADLGNVSALQWSAEIPFKRFAEGWNQPMQVYDMRYPGFWIFHERDIEPLAQWLAERLRRYAFPLLKGLDGVDAIALATGTKPISASPLYDAEFFDPYPSLLAAEMAKHPRLRGILDETEQALRALPKRSARQDGALALIARIRSRSRALLS